MKDKLQSIFVVFVRKTFTEERLLDLVDDLLDVFYDRFTSPDEPVDERMVDQLIDFVDLKEDVDADV